MSTAVATRHERATRGPVGIARKGLIPFTATLPPWVHKHTKLQAEWRSWSTTHPSGAPPPPRRQHADSPALSRVRPLPAASRPVTYGRPHDEADGKQGKAAEDNTPHSTPSPEAVERGAPCQHKARYELNEHTEPDQPDSDTYQEGERRAPRVLNGLLKPGQVSLQSLLGLLHGSQPTLEIGFLHTRRLSDQPRPKRARPFRGSSRYTAMPAAFAASSRMRIDACRVSCDTSLDSDVNVRF